MKKANSAFSKIFNAFKTNLISWFAVVLAILSIFKGLEFFAIICLVFLWIRNDSEMGIRLRQVFEQIGKEGIKLRTPPEETVSAEKPPQILSPKQIIAQNTQPQKAGFRAKHAGTKNAKHLSRRGNAKTETQYNTTHAKGVPPSI